MNFKRINNYTGWVVCLIACTVYIMTSEAGGSLWDCGEFVSSAFKVQIPHPPGAPLFVLLGRIFIVLFGDNPMTAAKAVNIMNALASGFTILFLFWTITHFARRIALGNSRNNNGLTKTQLVTIMGAGIIGALAYTFTDSFWYSAVEGEVYALSSFFTAIVFWAILKWEHTADEPGADKWIVLIFFLMGLSIGVHLLNLLTIPAIVMVYFFRKREHFRYEAIRKYFIRLTVIGGILGFIVALASASAQADSSRGVPMDATVAGLILLGAAAAIGLLYLVESYNKDRKDFYGGTYIFFVLSCVIVGVVQVGVIQVTIKAAGYFDIFFVNSLGMPFFSGFTVFFVLLAALIWLGLRVASKKGWYYLRLGLWCLAFMLIGYSSYLTTLIRSNADPAVDMYNVDNPMSLVGYLGREQYGDFPILYGQKFTAQPIDSKETDSYQKSKDKYIKVVRSYKYVYNKEDKMVFPRMWDASNDQNHADYYAVFMGIQKKQDGTYERPPTFMDNMRFFVSYQNYFMYLRYFFWNFSGRENDLQGLYAGNVRDGNWISGIPFMDSALYGDQTYLPDSIKHNKAHNTMFMLPFILGLIGMFYHFRKKGSDALVTLLLFYFTGFAIVIYLNQAGYQPRERDYAYVGSFYAFAIWIGLAVPYFAEMATKWDPKALKSMLISGGIFAALFLFGALAAGGGIGLGIGFAILFGAIAAGVPYIFKMLKSPSTIAYASIAVSLAVPVLMGQQEWDDHDRSKKQLARDIAKDYLESCAPNAILFTFGDNDTYPLWYAQEVEGIRRDIRVIKTSLLGTDWYVNQLRYKVNESAPIDLILSADQIEGNNRDVVFFNANPQFPEDRFYDLYQMMKDYVGSDVSLVGAQNGNRYNTFPVHKVALPVDKQLVLNNGTVNKTDSVVDAVRFSIPKNNLYKNDLAILCVIAANKWQRPIYFTMPYGELGFSNYIRRDGLSYRLVPVEGSGVNTNWTYNVVMNKFAFGGANIPGVYFDEENRRHLNTIRKAEVDLAFDLIEKGKKDSAKAVLQKVDKNMLQQNFPYGMVSRGNDHNQLSLAVMQAAYMADDKALAEKIATSVKTDLQQQLKYYNSLSGWQANGLAYEKQGAQELLDRLSQVQQALGGGNLPQAPEEGGELKPAADSTDTAKPATDTAK
ncbi:MAG: glycosyltransferase family 117 protein [Parafilimonas sp.]